MRLAAKFVLVFLAGAVGVLLVYGIFAVARERALFEDDIERDSRLISRSMRVAVESVWQDQGEGRALELIDQLDREEPSVRVRWIPAGEVARRRELALKSSDAGAGWSAEREISIRRTDGPHRAVATYAPIEVDGELSGFLEVEESLEAADAYTARTAARFAALAGAISLLVAILAVPIGIRFVGSPLNQLVAKTRRAGRGDFTGDLRIRSVDELGELAGAINAMCADLERQQQRIDEESEARLEALEQLRHEDRLKTVGRLASGVAHELGTPLNVIGGRAGLIAQGKLKADEILEAAAIIKRQANAMTAIVQQLLNFARRRAPETARVDLVPIVCQSLELLQPIARKQGVTIEFESSPVQLEADVDAGQIQQVVTNLVINAIQASMPGGKIRVAVGACGSGSESSSCLVVEDQGQGIAAEDLPHIFEPFFTTKRTGEGTGLGLSLVYGIVEEHGGRVEVSSTVGRGTRFEVRLPGLGGG